MNDHIIIGVLSLIVGFITGFFLCHKIKNKEKNASFNKEVIFLIVTVAWVFSFVLELGGYFVTPSYLHTFMGVLVAFYFKPFDFQKKNKDNKK